MEHHRTLSQPAPAKVCMHVLSVVRNDPRVLREATALIEAGFAVSIVDVEEQFDRPIEETLHGIHLHHLVMPQSFASTRFRKRTLSNAALLFMRAVRCLMNSSADIYHAHDVAALPACYLAAKLRRKPLIFDAHEIPLLDRPDAELNRSRRWINKILHFLLKQSGPHYAGVITVSPPIIKEMRTRYHIPKITLVRNMPVYKVVPKTDRLREYLGLASQTRIFLYQGNLHYGRALDKLVRAARFLEEGIVVVMMGKGTKDYLAELSALIASEGVADRVKIIPAAPYDELLSWTVSADLGSHIIEAEYSLNKRYCLTNKFFEYLMAGLPVLSSSSLEAIEELMQTHDVGQSVDSLEPEVIASAVNNMLADQVSLTRMSQNALQAAQELCWDKEKQQLIDLYKQIDHQ